MRENAPWEIEYINGWIRINENTRAEIASIMMDWHDGPKSAMRQIISRRPVKATKLIAEIDQALTLVQLGDIEEQRLAKLKSWAIRELNITKAASALRKAATKFHETLAAANFDSYNGARLFDAATKQLKG